ncbi:carbon-nitrogen hydrolase family protein [Novosphingobium piscinae]|uniref:Carbon-nitrogen hydrolase family protein n=1 Tax=Novosphingobium piscinae TaxID=1507448 RepID=A0A7X1G0T8_9SPHN|nr:carbon-nitrogen hydrolase family protein [Novosphingobium piscinae]MBC2670419.1 carbon-nitrogen hydrolase family protein [Novosphingobium piscinae]
MSTVRIALANLREPTGPADSVALAQEGIAAAAAAGALVVCFPECFVPGYRWPGRTMPPPDPAFLAAALAEIRAAAAAAGLGVVLGTERVTAAGLQIAAAVIGPDGTLLGWQDKVQLDPGEEAVYPCHGAGRAVFTVGPLTFGVAICHEGFRYPETVRAAARQGAQLVFHPFAAVAEPGSYRPTAYLDPANTFHEKAILCRAAENTVFVASVNCASGGAPMTSAVARPDGTALCWQPYGQAGLLIADLDLTQATGLLAQRCRS